MAVFGGKWRVGLPLKFILSISALIAVTSISLGVFFMQHDVALVTAELVERGRSLVRNLAFNGEYGVLIGNRELLGTLVRGLINQEDVLYVVIHDATGAVLAASKAEQLRAIPPADAPGRPWTGRTWADPSTRATQIDWEGDTVYEVTHPIRTREVRQEREALGFPSLPGSGVRGIQRERTIGLARMGMSLSVRRVSETLVGLRQAITLALFLVGLAGIIVTVLLVRVIVRPINELVTGTARLREGELDYRVSVSSRDEIGDLARSFNRMAHALRQREEELHAHGQELTRLNALLTGQQAELQRINAELAEASRHKSEFLANMSHELRTPLNAVIGFTELLAAGTYGPLPARVEEPLQEIRQNAKRLMGLISDVMDLAKIEAGRMELSCAEYLVLQVVESVATTVRPLAERKGLRLIVEVEPGLPEGYGDAQRITQALLNLAGNAVKFTETGEIQIRARRQNETFRFEVADTGVGVPGEVLDQIFEPFRQADASVTRGHGGGRPRAEHCQAIRRNARGPDLGRERPGSRLPVRLQYSHPSGAATMTSGIILHVEDNPSNRKLVRDLLGTRGYHLVEAETGEEALVLAERERPQLVLMDLELPVLSGLAVTERLRAHPELSRVPIVALTALAFRADVERARAAGCDAVLTKPYDPMELLRLVERYIGPPPAQGTA